MFKIFQEKIEAKIDNSSVTFLELPFCCDLTARHGSTDIDFFSDIINM